VLHPVLVKRHSSNLRSNLKRCRVANFAKLERQAALADATILLHTIRARNFLQALDLIELYSRSRLALRELEATAGFRLTIFLTLNNA